MEIHRTIDNATRQPTLFYGGALGTLAQGLLDGKALIFLGAGCNVDAHAPAAPPGTGEPDPAGGKAWSAGEPEPQGAANPCRGVKSGDGLPTAAMLSCEMAQACGLEWHEYIPLSTVAFYYESFYSREVLNSYLESFFAKPKVPPSATLRNLVEIITRLEARGVSTLVITTNYDCQLETAYHARTGREMEVIVYNGGVDANKTASVLHPAIRGRPLLWQPSSLTTLYKMHGCISMPESHDVSPPELHNLVITEEDYINFLSNALNQDESKYLLPRVLARISESTTLFIGYGLTDWNFRVVFKATAERNDKRGYAVQLFNPGRDPDKSRARHQAAVHFWGQKNVGIINVDGATFVADLAAALDREIDSRPPHNDRRRNPLL